jgi:3-oxoadipate enol-lactonase
MPRLTIGDHLEINLARTGPRGRTPLMFLHGLGLDLTLWDNQFEEFGRNHDVVALDLPGHGLSDGLESRPTLEGLAGAVTDVLAHLGVGSVHLVGVSLGGMIAQTVAVRHPSLIRSLTLVATSCTFADSVRLAIRDRAAVTRAEGMAVIAASHLERWFTPGFRERRPDVLDRLFKLLLRQDAELHASLWDAVTTLDIQGLSALVCPTMVIVGENDPSAPAAAGQMIVNQITGAFLHVVAGSGHFPPFETAGEFNALLRQFLLAMD